MDPWFLCEQLSQRDLGGRGTVFCTNAFEQINHGLIGADGVGGEAEIVGADVVVGKGLNSADFAGQVEE